MKKTVKGKTLIVTPSSFENGLKLQEILAEIVKTSELNLPGGESVDSMKDLDSQMLTKVIMNMALSAVSSPELKDVLFECCQSVVYNDVRVDREFFDEVENRGVFYDIMIEVLKENLLPFFPSLSSGLSGIKETMESFLKS